MGRGCKQAFFQRHTDGEQVHKKELNTANHQENANQSQNRKTPHTCRIAIIKKTRKNKHWRECREKRTSVHSWWECKLVWPLWIMI